MTLRKALFGLAAVGGISALVATNGEEYRIDLGSETSFKDTCARGNTGALSGPIGPRLVFTSISLDYACKADRAVMKAMIASPDVAIAAIGLQQGLNPKTLGPVLSCTLQKDQTLKCPALTQGPSPKPAP